MNTIGGKILVVDDDARGLSFLRGLLNSEGYELVTSTNGTDAIAAANTMHPDAILLDVMMPDMDGFEVCRRLRADPALGQVPIILLTALDDRDSKLEGLSSGADDFLTKPFDSTELLLRLRTITRLNRFKQLSEQRLRFEQMVELSPDGIVLVGVDCEILLANKEFARMANLSKPAEAVSQNFLDWLQPSAGEELMAALAALRPAPGIESGSLPASGGRTLELFIQTTESHSIPVELNYGSVPWQGQTAFQLILRDTSEKKRLEAQLARFQRIELLGELSGSIVHDMNNVLSAVSGNLNLLEMQMEMPEEAKGRMEIIQQSIMRGNGILRQLLNFTRGSDGSLQPVDISQIIKEVVDLVTPMLKYNYEIKVALEEGLPIIDADTNQLHQIFMNLCVNARDAMSAGGVLSLLGTVVSIDRLRAQSLGRDLRPGPYVRISVADTGTGMTPEVREKIFAPFFTTKAPGKGTGLGLATVMRLVTRHKGFITLDSELGKGTTFHCHFPIPEA